MELPGRGRALRAIWSESDAEVLAYMDVDLSTDLNALLPLVAPLLSGHSDLAIGTRLARGSRVIRGPKRELISRGYNMLLRTLMGARFSDAQCGFKAIGCDQARALLRLPRTPAGSSTPSCSCWPNAPGCASTRSPWTGFDDLDSRVDIIATALADLRGMARLGVGFARGSIQVPQLRGPVRADRHAGDLPLQIARFTVIGVASTIAYVALFLLLRGVFGSSGSSDHVGAGGQPGQPGPDRGGQHGREPAADVRHQRAVERGRHQVKGLIAFGIGLALTSGALAALGPAHPSRVTEISVLIAANLAATVIRFLLYKHWVFGRPKRAPDAWHHQGRVTVHTSEMATQGERTN